ncbi:MAG: VWA domain-containing protein [Candidatus Binatia bacterium]
MESPSLSYILAHFADAGFSLRYPIALVLLAGLPLVFRWTYPTGLLASLLRAGAYVAVVLAIAGAEITTRMPSERVTVIAAIDVSPSVDEAGREWARQYVNQLQSALAPDDELALLAFGSDIRLLRPPAPPAPLARPLEPIGRAATNLAAAIDGAVALLPAEGRRQVLLLTDGNETHGDSRHRLPWLRAGGVRIDAAIPPQRAGTDVSIDNLVAPPLVGADSVSQIGIVAHNDGPLRSAVLNLYLDDQIADSAAVELPPGSMAIMMPAQLSGEGSYRLRAELAVDDDPKAANNVRDVGITIRERSRALVLTARRESAVARALQRKQLQVDVRPPATLRSEADLAPYHVVVLEDITPAQLTAPGLDVLESWVRVHGGGLVVSGGGNTFDSRFAQTALKRLLPVTLESRRPKRPVEREPMALMLVIDRSNSMGFNSRTDMLRDGEKMRYAKEAALAVVGQLKDRDLVGLIAFDSEPYEIAALSSLRQNRKLLEERIPLLVENGGTDFYAALEIAHRQLAASGVSQRHVILLTDGDTNRPAADDYREIIGALAHDGVAVTTIRVGDNRINLKLLQDLSQQTGGEFHYVQDAQSLPDLMLRETARAAEPEETATEVFYPEVGAQSQLLRGIDQSELPPLTGYASAKAKDGADVLLRVRRSDRQDPLLAVWQYGLGRVAAFTASPTTDTERWLAWREFAKFWSQITHWVAREHSDDEVAIDARRRDGVTELQVRTFGPSADGASLIARVAMDDAVREIPMVPRQPRLFTANLLGIQPGRYTVTIVKRSPTGEIREHTEPVSIPSADLGDQAEFERNAPNTSLLSQITEATGGRLNAEPRELAFRETGERRAGHPLDFVLLPLAMVLFLADTAVRRLGRWHVAAPSVAART